MNTAAASQDKRLEANLPGEETAKQMSTMEPVAAARAVWEGGTKTAMAYDCSEKSSSGPETLPSA